MDSTPPSGQRLVILVRHASRELQPLEPEASHAMLRWNADVSLVKPHFRQTGLPLTLAIAGRLADELGNVRVTRIRHSEHLVAAQTARACQWMLAQRGGREAPLQADAALTPGEAGGDSVTDLHRRLTGCQAPGPGEAVIVVGHQPALTHLARALYARQPRQRPAWWRRLPADTLPLGGSEAACFRLCEGGGATLLWMLTAKPDALLADLKQKIASKYDVAKFFLGAFVVNTGFILSGDVWDVAQPLAIALVLAGMVLSLVALALTAATLMSYDALLMPQAFWTEAAADHHTARSRRRDGRAAGARQPKPWSVLRPPSQAHVVLFYEMVHVWSVFFIPALSCAFAAVGAFLAALALDLTTPDPAGAGDGQAALIRLAVIVLVVVAALTLPLALHYRVRRPSLGFED